MTSQEDLFFTQTGMERSRVQGLVDKTLHGPMMASCSSNTARPRALLSTMEG